MISRATGEIGFEDGLLLRGDQEVVDVLPVVQSTTLPFPGWAQHDLGRHDSEYGTFQVEIVCGAERRVQMVLLQHQHAFYEKGTPHDGERRAFHEGILARDLSGQREFSWGQAFRHLDVRENTDTLVVAYSEGPHVVRPTVRHLFGLEAVNEDPSETGHRQG